VQAAGFALSIMRTVMLEREIAEDINRILAWAISRNELDGKQLEADRVRALWSYLNSSINTESDLMTITDLARMGGQTITPAKQNAARKNGAKGGAPGNYHAYTIDPKAPRYVNRRQATYVVFDTKENRNRWVQLHPPGEWQPVAATDTDLRWTQRNHLELILDGDACINSLEEQVDYFDQFERLDDWTNR